LKLLKNLVKKNGRIIQYASEKLKANKELALLAVKENGFAIIELDEKLQADEDVMLSAVQQNGNSLQYLPEEQISNLYILWEAVDQNKGAYRHAAPMYKKDLIGYSKMYKLFSTKNQGNLFILSNINFHFE
jgi:hypothetical protein